MPRNNRPRGRGDRGPDDEFDAERAIRGRRRTEQKRDGIWNVQPLTSTHAAKTYVCPGCSLEIPPGLAHVVAWRADGLFGEESDLAARRHWHTRCWSIRT